MASKGQGETQKAEEVTKGILLDDFHAIFKFSQIEAEVE